MKKTDYIDVNQFNKNITFIIGYTILLDVLKTNFYYEFYII